MLLQIPELYREACKKLIWFYKCGREDYHKIKGNEKGKNKQIYSYKFVYFSLFHFLLSYDNLLYHICKTILIFYMPLDIILVFVIAFDNFALPKK